MNYGLNLPGGATRREALELLGMVLVMAMIPENPLVGGTVLRRAAIQSPNFVTTVSGWSINQDGSAEFNNVTIRNGQVISGTQLYYSSLPPVSGNLIASISTVSGTDSAGNAYLPGIVTYKKITATDFRAVSHDSGGINFWKATAAGGPWSLVFSITLQADEIGVNFASNVNAGSVVMGEALAALEVSGGVNVLDTGIVWAGGATGDKLALSNAGGPPILSVTNTLSSSTAALQVKVNNATGDVMFTTIAGGLTSAFHRLDTDTNGQSRILLGNGVVSAETAIYRAAAHLFGIDPVAFNNAGTAEVDQVPTFANSWAQVAGRVLTSFRRVAQLDDMEIVGSVTVPVGVANGQNMTTAIPAAYRPAHTQSFTGWDITTNLPVRLDITNGGLIQFAGPVGNTAAGHTMDIPCQLIRLTE